MNWVGLIGAAIVVVTFLGTAAQYLRGSRDKGTITTLSQNNEALDERVKILEDSERRLKAEAVAQAKVHEAEIRALNVRVDALEAENAALHQQRPSAEVLANISDRLDQHDSTMRQLGEKIVTQLENAGTS